MAKDKNSLKEGYKHLYCINCQKKLLIPTKEGICHICKKVKMKKQKLEKRDYFNKTLLNFEK